MAVTGAIQYSVETDDSAIVDTMRRNIEARISFQKETKKGPSTIEFGEAVIDFRIEGTTLTLLLPAGDGHSLRIDRAVMALAEIPMEELHRIRLTRRRQFRRTENGLQEIG